MNFFQMQYIKKAWDSLEEIFIVFLLTAMTLITAVYVVFNNLYTFFYFLADSSADFSEGLENFFFVIGDFILDLAQAMTWSNALSKALFGWLIFFGVAYGVRIGGHIGVDALVKLASDRTQKFFALIACSVCMGYAALLSISSYEWVTTMFQAAIGADDLGQFGVKQWHITLIVPLSFALVFLRYVEILIRILRNQQVGLGLADEAADAMKLSDEG